MKGDVKMSDFNQDHHFGTWDKIWMLGCGLIVAACITWVTYVYFEYRVVNMAWKEAGYHKMSPEQFWDIPTATWKPVFDKFKS